MYETGVCPLAGPLEICVQCIYAVQMAGVSWKGTSQKPGTFCALGLLPSFSYLVRDFLEFLYQYML